MATVEVMQAPDVPVPSKKRVFKHFTYRGLELAPLLDCSTQELGKLSDARARRRLQRGARKGQATVVNKLRAAKLEAAEKGEGVETVRTHMRNLIVLPEMVGSRVGVYNGKQFNEMEIKAEMIGHYLGEFSITYKPIKHGRPGIGSTKGSMFIAAK